MTHPLLYYGRLDGKLMEGHLADTNTPHIILLILFLSQQRSSLIPLALGFERPINRVASPHDRSDIVNCNIETDRGADKNLISPDCLFSLQVQ